MGWHIWYGGQQEGGRAARRSSSSHEFALPLITLFSKNREQAKSTRKQDIVKTVSLSSLFGFDYILFIYTLHMLLLYLFCSSPFFKSRKHSAKSSHGARHIVAHRRNPTNHGDAVRTCPQDSLAIGGSDASNAIQANAVPKLRLPEGRVDGRHQRRPFHLQLFGVAPCQVHGAHLLFVFVLQCKMLVDKD
jgi:hypothetical protein